MDNNILDTIIKTQEIEKKAGLNLQELVNFILKDLNQREREIINIRYGLENVETKTLDAIGKKYGITRERVRQIEKNAFKKAHQTIGLSEKMVDLISAVVKCIYKGGHICLEENLFNDILENSLEEAIDQNRLRFILKYFLNNYVELVNIVHTERAWKVKDKSLPHYLPLIDNIKTIFEKRKVPLHLLEIIKILEKEIIGKEANAIIREIDNWQAAVSSYLQVSQHFKKNLFDKWGLIQWPLVNPKRMRDKIYLILQKYENPMHFKVIADKINLEKFDNKLAYSATIHNELILDNRFVLVGRGIYALKDWGYQPGIIVDVIKQILSKTGMALNKEEIVEEVLKCRRVKEESVNLILSDKNIFEVLEDGRYRLKV